jgi:hypothetical protein
VLIAHKSQLGSNIRLQVEGQSLSRLFTLFLVLLFLLTAVRAAVGAALASEGASTMSTNV